MTDLHYNPSVPPWVQATVSKFKSVFGEPIRTQTIQGQTYWYYKCVDGLIQVVAIDLSQTGPNFLIQSVNDY